TSERLHQQRNPSQCGQVLCAVSFVIIESQRLLGGGNTFRSHIDAFYGLPSPNGCELPTLPHPSGLDSNVTPHRLSTDYGFQAIRCGPKSHGGCSTVP